MPKQEGQKSKLLALLRIFEQQTDENHLLNVPQLVELLEAQGIRCERKSVYSDIEALGALGYDIKLRRGRGGGYFLASRTFDLAELKLLVDAVQASRVVSGTTSRRLIHKLEKLCSNYEGSQLQRQVYVEGRPKTDSKSLLYSIDALHEAINNGKMVEFLYRKADSREKEKRTVSPWQLAWENGCYYLIAFADEKGIRHYRVDKMSGVRVLDAPRRGQEQFADLDLPAYLRKHFGMYGGPEHRVTLRCTADLEGAMRERFGATPMFLPEENGCFHFDVPICVSDQFYGWVCGFAAGNAGDDRPAGRTASITQKGLQKQSFLRVYGSFNSRSLGRIRSRAAAGSATRRRLWWKMAFSSVLRARRPLPAVRASDSCQRA